MLQDHSLKVKETCDTCDTCKKMSIISLDVLLFSCLDTCDTCNIFALFSDIFAIFCKKYILQNIALKMLLRYFLVS